MQKRWLATVEYASDNGTVDVVHDIEELEELQGIIERGPDWHSIQKIEIVLQRPVHRLVTLEEAKALGQMTPSEAEKFLDQDTTP